MHVHTSITKITCTWYFWAQMNLDTEFISKSWYMFLWVSFLNERFQSALGVDTAYGQIHKTEAWLYGKESSERCRENKALLRV